MSAKFYICEKCGNLVGVINASGVPMKCCGQNMTALEPGVVEASHEKHIPVVDRKGSHITVTAKMWYSRGEYQCVFFLY